MDLNIIIRTFLIKEGRAYVQAGAGIVADSDPEARILREPEKSRGAHKNTGIFVMAVLSLNGVVNRKSCIILFKYTFVAENPPLTPI